VWRPKQTHDGGDLLTKIILEMRVSRCRSQVRVSNPFFHQIARHSVRLKHRDAAMPESVQPCRCQIQFLENLIELASHVALAKRCASTSLKHSPTFAISQMCSQHLSQRRLYVDRSIALFRLDRDLFAVPDATADINSAHRKVQVFDMQPECFPTSQPCTSQRC